MWNQRNFQLENLFLQHPCFPLYVALVILLVVFFGLSLGFKLKEGIVTFLGIVLMALPIGYFFVMLLSHAINVPNSDDYGLFESVYKLRHASSIPAFVSALFEQVNQHRFGFEHLVMLLIFTFTGTINIPTLLLIGNLFMLGTAYLIYLVFQKEKLCWYFFIPIPYIIFNFTYAENALWGIAAIQNTPLIFFAFLTIYALSHESRTSFFLALLGAIVTTFISGSGMLTWVIGVLFLVFKQKWSRLIFWILVAAGVFLFYFLYDYTFIKSESESVFRHPIFNTLLLWGFWGNALYLNIPHPLVPKFYPDMVWCAVLGALFTVIMLFWMVRYLLIPKITWSYWFLLGAAMFMMGTGVMFVMSRPSNNFFMYGGQILSLRYMIFGVVLLAIMYVYVLVMLKNQRIFNFIVGGLVLIGGVLLNFSSYYLGITYAHQLHDELALDGYYWKNHKTFLTQGDNFGDIPFWNHPTRMKELVDKIEGDHIISLEVPAEISSFLKGDYQAQRFNGVFQVNHSQRIGPNNLEESYVDFNISAIEPTSMRYIILKSNARTLVLPALPQRNSIHKMLSTHQYYSSDFGYGCFRTKLPKEKTAYETWLVSVEDGEFQYQLVNQKATL